MRHARAIAILLAAMPLGAQEFEQSIDEAFDTDTLVISASKNACHRFDIYMALSRQQKSRGLMFVRDLPEHSGMLFVYQRPQQISLWMKNTFIPLDMVFIRIDGSISSIETDAEPQSLASIHAIEPLNFVLELNAGVTEKLHIDTDSEVYLPDGYVN